MSNFSALMHQRHCRMNMTNIIKEPEDYIYTAILNYFTVPANRTKLKIFVIFCNLKAYFWCESREKLHTQSGAKK